MRRSGDPAPLTPEEIEAIERVTATGAVVRHTVTAATFWRDPSTGDLMQSFCVHHGAAEIAPAVPAVTR